MLISYYQNFFNTYIVYYVYSEMSFMTNPVTFCLQYTFEVEARLKDINNSARTSPLKMSTY
jgi:hypothetical protein